MPRALHRTTLWRVSVVLPLTLTSCTTGSGDDAGASATDGAAVNGSAVEGSSIDGSAIDASVEAAADATPAALFDAAGDATTGTTPGATVVATFQDGSGDVTAADASTDSSEPLDDGGTEGSTSSGGPSLVAPGADLQVFGVTGDGHVIYLDRSAQNQSYYAGSLDGGAPVPIYTVPSTLSVGDATVLGNLAFVFGFSGNSYLGPLVLWGSGLPQPVTLTTTGLAYLYQTVWASNDSAHIAYLSATRADGTISSLYGANADGTGVTLLAANLDTNASDSPFCFPRLVFRGSVAVVSYCTAADAGNVPTIQSFAVPGWGPSGTMAPFVAPAVYDPIVWDPASFPFAVDPDGTWIATASPASAGGAIQAFPIDGGTSVVLDPGSPLLSTESMAGSRTDPWSVFTTNDAGALLRVSPANPSPLVLVDAGVSYFDALSSDGKWMLVSSALNPLGWYSDVSVVSTQTAGAPALFVSSGADGGAPVATDPTTFGHPGPAYGFTADGAYVVAYTALSRLQTNQWVGHVVAAPASAPGVVRSLSTGATLASVYLSGSKVLLCDVPDVDGGGPYGDLNVFDLAAGGPPSPIASGTGTNCNVVASSDGSWVVYSNQHGAAPGLYATFVP
jgi:hypothetical protein